MSSLMRGTLERGHAKLNKVSKVVRVTQHLDGVAYESDDATSAPYELALFRRYTSETLISARGSYQDGPRT